MRVRVEMPRLSESMTEGAVTAWFAAEGDEVREGEAIAEIETEKSTVDLPAPASGVLAQIVVAAGGGAIAVGTLLAEIETDVAAARGASPAQEPAGSPRSLVAVRAQRDQQGDPAAITRVAGASGVRAGSAPPATSAIAAAGPASKGTGVAAPMSEHAGVRAAAGRAGSRASAAALGAAPEADGRTDVAHDASTHETEEQDDAAVPATPLARRMAAQAGVSLASLRAAATGIGGKVCRADVEAALGRAPASRAVRAGEPAARTDGAAALGRSPASRESRAGEPAARADGAGTNVVLSRVRRTVAERMARAKATIPHFYLSVDCRVDRLLEVRRRLKDDGTELSINDFVVRATAIALARVPDANASWNDGIVRHARIDIAVAVALDDGLVTPVVRDAAALGLAAVSQTLRDLAQRARAGALAPHEYDGATFTISNLGMHGIDRMFAIINPPQACILGVGAAEARPVVDGGQVVAGTVMTLSLSADHRVLDGAAGAKLLSQIRRLLEEPALMLA